MNSVLNKIQLQKAENTTKLQKKKQYEFKKLNFN